VFGAKKIISPFLTNMNVLELRQKLTNILDDLLGEYTFVNGRCVKAIAVVPDSVYGYDYPPTGTKVTGLEMVIWAEAKLDTYPIIQGTHVVNSTQVVLKQWDDKKTTVEATNRLISCLGNDKIEVRPRVMPVPGLNNIETQVFYIKSVYLVDLKII
jgi:hypothetical protein